MKEPKSKTSPPTLSFAKPEPENQSDVQTETDTLVNENPSEEYVSDPNQPPPPELTAMEELQALVAKLEQDNGNLRIKNNELSGKVAAAEKTKSNYSDVSRKFRIFLNILQGFAARGAFDQSELMKKPGSEHNIMRHAVGLTEVAQKATENRF